MDMEFLPTSYAVGRIKVKSWHSPLEDGVAFQCCDGSAETIQGHHHLLVLVDAHSPPDGGVQHQLVLPLAEELLYFLLGDGPLGIEDHHLVRQYPVVEVSPVAAAHIPSDDDVAGPDVELGPPVWDIDCGEEVAKGKVDGQQLTPV